MRMPDNYTKPASCSKGTVLKVRADSKKIIYQNPVFISFKIMTLNLIKTGNLTECLDFFKLFHSIKIAFDVLPKFLVRNRVHCHCAVGRSEIF